jgi:glyoxylase-like metal-dependent hydrolase (beta-lactamase superfamily II)
MEIAPGLYALPQIVEPITVDRDQTTIHPAAVETRQGLLLLDTTYPGEFEQLADSLAEIGWNVTDVTGIVLTHQDVDHAGSTAAAVERTGATVYAHERCAPHVDGRLPRSKNVGDEPYPTAPVDVELVDGVTFATNAGPMTVVYTPGHSPGHISLYFPDQRLLLTGDAMAAPEGPLEGPHEAFTLDMETAWESVERLTDLAIDRTLCHHGGLLDVGSERICELVEQTDE